MHVSSPQDAALLTFAHRLDLADSDAFREIVIYVHDHGALPPCYLTKRAAENDGWRPGGDLWSVAAGDAIGGDRYSDREHRLIFVRGMGESWLIFVSVDHYRHFARFTPAAAR
ncbi:MAG: hypothetical protein WCF13_04945 [Stellaceae bacterium]